MAIRRGPARWLLTSLALCLLTFQNCEFQGFQVKNDLVANPENDNLVNPTNESPPTNSGGEVKNPTKDPLPTGCQTKEECDEEAATALIAELTPQFTNDCLNSSSVNACLFYKNPYVSNQGPFPSIANNTMDLRSLQGMGVVLDEATYDKRTGCLQNPTYGIVTDITVDKTTINGQYACFSDLNFKVGYFNDTKFKLSAIMAHFYLNTQKDFMKAWTGKWYGENKGVDIFSYVKASFIDNNAAFMGDPSSLKGAIVMGGYNRGMPTSSAVQEMALNAEIYLHEAGHANVFFAGNNIEDPNLNLKCGTSSRCCSSSKGCYGAINEGQADYHAFILFPEHPSIGESLVNSSAGLVEFGMSRNYSQLRDLTAQQAYEAPSNNTFDGEIHGMGRIWGSIWYESRLTAQKQFKNRGVRSIDRLFTAHLAVLTGDDDFQTACEKTRILARTIDGGLVQNIFSGECQRRGF